MRKLTILLILCFLLSGCATLNFSSKYYSLPDDYSKDLSEVWNDIILKAPLKYGHSYSYKIVKDKETKLKHGMPEIEGSTIAMPEYFIKYVWEFYYPNYHKAILTCVLLHEISHYESGFDSSTPQIHYQCDAYAVKNLMLGNLPYSPSDYYSSMVVANQYWKARKGAGGHAALIAWNSANLFSMAMGGPSMIGDLYALDLNTRVRLLKKDYPDIKFVFQRTKKKLLR